MHAQTDQHQPWQLSARRQWLRAQPGRPCRGARLPKGFVYKCLCYECMGVVAECLACFWRGAWLPQQLCLRAHGDDCDAAHGRMAWPQRMNPTAAGQNWAKLGKLNLQTAHQSAIRT
eukprot:308153-Chlamydomonas_euryale.AAC.2